MGRGEGLYFQQLDFKNSGYKIRKWLFPFIPTFGLFTSDTQLLTLN